MRNHLLREFNRVEGDIDPWVNYKGRANLESSIDKVIGRASNRHELVERYSWAVPNVEAIYVLVQLSPIVEIGAGTGYWARLIHDAGGDIVAYDNMVWKKQHHGRWFPVQYGGPGKVRSHPDRTLFLCWPPYAKPMAWQALRNYKGARVVYVGEDSSGCTGCDKFHNLLDREWREQQTVQLPQWWGIYDRMKIYARRGKGNDRAEVAAHL